MIKSIKGYPNYGVDKAGNVWNTVTSTKLKPRTTNDGYLQVALCKDGICLNKYVHRLVAAAFHGGVTSGMVVNHNDGDKKNNKSTNLTVVTQKVNIAHAEKTKLITRGKDGKFK